LKKNSAHRQLNLLFERRLIKDETFQIDTILHSMLYVGRWTFVFSIEASQEGYEYDSLQLSTTLIAILFHFFGAADHTQGSPNPT